MKKVIDFLKESEGKSKVKRIILPKSNGINGIFETVKIMELMRDYYKTDIKIRTFVLKHIKELPKGQNRFLYNGKQVFDLLNARLIYTPDVNGVESIMSPRYTWKYRHGDCDDMALIGSVFLETVGIQTKFVIVGTDGIFTHIYLYMSDGNGNWIPFDLTRKKWAYEDKRYNLKKIF